MDITIIVLVVVTCLMLGLAVFYHVKTSGTEKVMRERIEGKVAPNTDRYTYLKQFMSKGLSSLGNANAPTNTAEAAKLKKDLQAAGYRTEKAPILFAGSKVLFMASLPMALFLVHPNWTKTAPATTLMACYVVLAGIGFYAPQVWLHKQIEKRQRKIAEGFPDALDLMVICVEAGLSLNSAIGRIGDEMKLAHKELSEEFHFLSLELRTGLSRQQALRNLSTRVGLEEVRNLVSVLIQTDRFGTSVAHALSVLSESMRKMRQHKAEEEAAKLPVKLLFPLMFFILPSLFIVIIGPAALRIMQTLMPTLKGGN